MLAASVSFARAELLKALDQDEIRLAFQPQIDLTTQQIVGFEGVARWYHPTFGVLTPGLFLGLASREGLVSAIGRRLIGDAAKAVCSWRARGHRVDVGINLSASDMTDPRFGSDILEAIRAHGALPHWIVLEASEEALAFDGEAAFAGLEVLAGMGFKIALDARGPTIIALDKRARALFCQLKCGGSTMLSVASKLHRVGASGFMRRLDAARGANIPVVAVGAESQDEMDLCAELGFTRLQGRVISMPVSVELCTQLLDRIGVHTPVAAPVKEPIALPELAPITSDQDDLIAAADAETSIPKPIAHSSRLTLYSLEFASNLEEDVRDEAA